MEFQTEWNRKSEPTEAGNEYLPQYIEAIDKKGKKYLKEIEPKNIFEQIQTEAEGCDIYQIIDKYLQTGDETLLNKRKGMFADFVNIPKNPIDIHNTIIEAESKFEQMDRELRAEFENDVNVFKTSILDGTFEDRVAHYIGQMTKAEKAAETKAEFEKASKEVKIDE